MLCVCVCVVCQVCVDVPQHFFPMRDIKRLYLNNTLTGSVLAFEWRVDRSTGVLTITELESREANKVMEHFRQLCDFGASRKRIHVHSYRGCTPTLTHARTYTHIHT